MRAFPFVLLPLLASAALAQAPVITPAGDPSVKNDTIYGLAVNPADYPDEPYVYLLDDGVVRLEADGRGTRTYRQVVQVLTQEGAEQWGEQVFSYSRSREKLTINWLRVLRPDGTVISAQPTHEQESDAPTALQAPIYSDIRLHRASLGGVAPGTLVDWSYTVETLQPVMPGDFFSGWSVTTGRPTRRSRFLVDVPDSLTPRIKERNVRFARRTTVAHGRRVYEWATADVPKPPEREPFEADSDDVHVGVTVAPRLSWGDVARWYAGLSKDRYTVTPALAERLAQVVGAQRTRDDSLRALYRWVAQDFRYVSVSLGLAGFQPRAPADVLETKYGDCKDKATLFVALARRMGFQAYPVLLSLNGGIDRSLPSARQFDHMIAAVERPGGYLYLDLTADAIPVGLLPPSENGEFALVVHPDGRGEEVTLPPDSATVNRATDLLEGELSPDGHFTGRLVETRTGIAEVDMRESMSHDLTATQRANIARNIANGVFDGAEGDSLALFDGRDLTAPARVSLVIRNGKATTAAGSSDILTLPMEMAVAPRVVASVAAHVPRHYPIDAMRVFGRGEAVQEFRVTLPPGWKARLPAGVTASGPFGTYESSYTQDGRLLRVVRRTVGARGILPPDRVGDLLDFMRAVARDDARFIVLEH
jgi:hypothetical protein